MRGKQIISIGQPGLDAFSLTSILFFVSMMNTTDPSSFSESHIASRKGYRRSRIEIKIVVCVRAPMFSRCRLTSFLSAVQPEHE